MGNEDYERQLNRRKNNGYSLKLKKHESQVRPLPQDESASTSNNPTGLEPKDGLSPKQDLNNNANNLSNNGGLPQEQIEDNNISSSESSSETNASSSSKAIASSNNTSSSTALSSKNESNSALGSSGDNDKKEKTGIAKLIEFYKKHKVLCNILFTVIFWVLISILALFIMVFLVYIILHTFSLIFGLENDDFTREEEIKEMQLEDFQNFEGAYSKCYDNNGGIFSKIWDKIRPGMSSPCEVLLVIDKDASKAEKRYQKYDLTISRGLILSTIIYTYSHADDITASPSDPFSMLEDITKNGRLTEFDIQKMISNMIFHENYRTYNSETCEIEEEKQGFTCKIYNYENYYFDREKYKLFLLYGEDATRFYELALNFESSAGASDCICAPDSIRNRTLFNDYSTFDSFEIDNRDSDMIKEYISSDRYTQNFNYWGIPTISGFVDVYVDLFNGTTHAIGINNIIRNEDLSYTNGFIYNKFADIESYEDISANIINRINSLITYEKTLENVLNEGEYENLENYVESSESVLRDNLACYEELKPQESEDICKAVPISETPASDDIELISGPVCDTMHSDTMVRLYYIPGRDCNKHWTNPNDFFPGGPVKSKVKSGAYEAKDAITVEQYLKGVLLSEWSTNYKFEDLQFYMMLAKGMLYYEIIGKPEIRVLENPRTGETEYFIEATSCFQNYKQSRYVEQYLNSNSKDIIDEVYNSLDDYIYMNADGSVTGPHYNKIDMDNVFTPALRSGYTFMNMMSYPGLTKLYNSNYEKFYSTASLKTCSEENAIVHDNPGEDINPRVKYASDDEINHFINTANAYHGKTREQFKSVAKKYSGYTIGDNTSWCAIFVSSIINESKINKYKGLKSQSVSEFMKKMINSNRFYHSEYWYKQSKKYKDPSGPQPGDIVFFAKESCGYTGNGNLPSKSADCYRHIGIVTDVKGGYIYYTHGNTSSCSKTNGVCAGTKEKINDPYIIGYGR